jgi:hypothetical protein
MSFQEPYSMLAAMNPLEKFAEIIYNNSDLFSCEPTKPWGGADAKESSTTGTMESSQKNSKKESENDSSQKKATAAEERGAEEKNSGFPRHLSEEKKNKLNDIFGVEVIDAKVGGESIDESDEREISVQEMLVDEMDPPGSSFDLPVLNYATKILYMICCQSEEAREILKNDKNIVKSLFYRLTRCLVDSRHLFNDGTNNYNTSSGGSEKKLSSSTTADNSTATSTTAVSPANEWISSSSSVPKMMDFPYSNDNYTLFSTICRMFYLMDVYSLLEKRVASSFSSPMTVIVAKDFLDYFASENQANYLKKLDEIESIDDINLVIKAAKNSSNNNNNQSNSFRSVRSLNNNENSGNHEKSVSIHQVSSPSSQDTPQKNSRNYESLSALELLNFIAVVVLTIGPYDRSLYITGDHDLSSTFYSGNLTYCEECVLQLLMLSSDENIDGLFSSATVTVGSSVGFPAAGEKNPAMELIVQHRRLFLANSLIRILTTILQKLKNLDLSEKAALLSPIIVSPAMSFSFSFSFSSLTQFFSFFFFSFSFVLQIVSMKVIKSDERSFQIMKRLVFPNPVSSHPVTAGGDPTTTATTTTTSAVKAAGTGGGGVSSSLFSSSSSMRVQTLSSSASAAHVGKDKDHHKTNSSGNMAPADCPENSIRFALIQFMTSVETNIKRCVSEFLFLLCDQNSEFFCFSFFFSLFVLTHLFLLQFV